MKSLIQNSLDEHLRVAQAFVGDAATVENIDKAARLIADSIKAGGKVLT